MESIITIRDLKFSYKAATSDAAKLILNIPQLDFKTHETVFLFGSSGSGKTTLLEILAGVLTPDSGEVKILGENFAKLSLSEKDRFRAAHVGYIFQQFNLIPYLSVKENIELPQTFNHKKSNPDLYKKLIQTLGLTAFENQRADQLSVGQQQRVAAARALIVEPKLILADEPTSALDYDHRESFLKILFQLAKEQGSSVLFVSHDRSIQHLFDRQLNLLDVNIL